MTYSHITRRTGSIKFWKGDKGFGFIVPDEPGVNGGNDIFVHISNTEGKSFEKGQKVTFVLDMDKRSNKPAAFDVQVAA